MPPLWKLTKPGVDLVMYTSIEPKPGQPIIASSFFYADGTSPSSGYLLSREEWELMYTRNVERLTDNFPEWWTGDK